MGDELSELSNIHCFMIDEMKPDDVSRSMWLEDMIYQIYQAQNHGAASVEDAVEAETDE